MISWIEQGPSSASVGEEFTSSLSFETGETQIRITEDTTILAGLASTNSRSEFGSTATQSSREHFENFSTENFGETSQTSSASSSISQTSVSPSTDSLHGETSYSTGSSTFSGYTEATVGSTLVVDSFGSTATFGTTSNVSDFASFTGESGITATGHTNVTDPITSFSHSTTTSGIIFSSTLSTVSSTTSTTSAGTVESWQTTSSITTTFNFISWTESEGTFSEWTTDSTNTGSVSETFVTSTSYTRSWHWDTVSTTDGGGTVSTSVTSSVETSSISVVDDAPRELGFFAKTVYLPSPCNQLYTAGPIGGIQDFCNAYGSVDSTTLIPELSFTSTTSGDSAEDSSSSETETTALGFTTQESTKSLSDTASGLTQSSYEFSTFALPQPITSIFSAIFDPDLAAGYQPWTAMDTTDKVYSSYTIHIATSVTGTDEAASRKLGLTFNRHGVTQIVPISSNDTLQMQTSLSASITSYIANGGFGGTTGNNSWVADPGVYSVSQYSIDTDGDRVSYTYVTTFEDATTVTFPEGDLWTASVYSSTVLNDTSIETIYSVYSSSSSFTSIVGVLVTEINCAENTDRS